MEFYKTKICGWDVWVTFTGTSYYFFNRWYGWLAIADRTTPADKINTGYESFRLTTGNHRTDRQYEIKSAAKRFIRKCERKYIAKTKVDFEEVHYDLDFFKLEFNPIYYKK